MILALFLTPFLSGLITLFLRNDILRRIVFITSACVYFILSLVVCFNNPQPILKGWFALDSLGKLFLLITSLLFLAASVYALRYLSQEKQNPDEENELEDIFVFQNAPEAVFTGCLLLFLSAMTLVILSHHFGIIWVSMEATTLVSAPLIYFHRHTRSLEATWKYLLICSVGIALALLGNLFLAVSQLKHPGELLLSSLIIKAPQLDIMWLKAAFIFIFIGYGTKMGLAPLHTWLPDAHSEAPSIISALLSGALLNCSFLGILRAYQVCSASGLQLFCQEIFILFGVISLIFAALFILGQTDYKRMLAYSSIEHMGILSLGIGLGGNAVFGVLLNAVNHSLTKCGLFFIAGNILNYYKTKYILEVRGVIKDLPASGVLWLIGFFLITGMPPSGIFLSKFIILKEAIERNHYWVAIIFLITLAIIFIAMSRIFIPMAQGESASAGLKNKKNKESFALVVPTMILFAFVIFMGLYLPPWLNQLITEAAKSLGNL